MGKDTPQLRLFSLRFTMMAFHGLVWSFLWQSSPEFHLSSYTTLTSDTINSTLVSVRVFGAIFLALTALITLCGFSLHSIGSHYFFIVTHSLGILLTVVSILNFWEVRLLWVPAILCCLLPFLVEFIGVILICAGKSQHF